MTAAFYSRPGTSSTPAAPAGGEATTSRTGLDSARATRLAEHVDATNRDPRRSSFGVDYWLRRCDGFGVDSAGGRLGVVKEIRYGPTSEPELLVVRTGRLGRRRVLVPTDAVVEILPEERRLVVASGGTAAGGDS